MKMITAKLTILIFLVFSSIGLAQAETWNWSYTGPDVLASGTFTTAGDASTGDTPILSFEGVRNGQTISGLTSTNLFPFSNTFNNSGIDKYFNFDGPVYGITSIPGGVVNVYAAAGIAYREFTVFNGVESHRAVNLTITAAVPEPETYAMLLAGLGLIGFISRKKKPGEENEKTSLLT